MRGKKKEYEERLKIVKAICDSYTKGNTIETCCANNLTPYRTFKDWIDEVSEFAELYKKAQDKRQEIYYQDLKKCAETSLEKLVKGWEAIETHEEGIPGPEGTVLKTKIIRKKKIFAPVPSAVFFTLTNIDPENWKNIQTNNIQGKLEIDNLNKVSDDDLDKRIKELESKVGGDKKKKA